VEALGTRFFNWLLPPVSDDHGFEEGGKLEVVCSEMALKRLRLIRPRTSPTE